MGAISSPTSLPILRPYLTHENRAIRETAEIAVAKIEWDNSPEGIARAEKKYVPSLSVAMLRRRQPIRYD